MMRRFSGLTISSCCTALRHFAHPHQQRTRADEQQQQQRQQPGSAYGSNNKDRGQQQAYAGADDTPQEGRSKMAEKSRKIVTEGDFFTHPDDATDLSSSRTRGSGSRLSASSPRAPEDLSRSEHDSVSPTPADLDTSTSAPGDTFGTYETRQPFLKPVKRNTPSDNTLFADIMPPDAPPERCLAPEMLRRLCGKFALRPKEALHLMIDCNHDINEFLHRVEQTKPRGTVRAGDYGLVALEAYDPETFCLVNFTLPSYQAARHPEMLEALYELTLSAAEIPVDTPRDKVVDRFLGDWTTEGDEQCSDVLKHFDVGVRDIVLLPYGEYSSQGFYIAHANNADFPNVGTAAAAACYDLRSGIHARFRFHAERNADSVAEHLVKEQRHFDQHQVHTLRQQFWFNPSYSVEDFLRYKESLLMPSATIFELRTAVMAHNLGGRAAYRNVVEVEKVKIAQHKLEKGGKEQQMQGSLFDSGGVSKVIASMKAPQQGHGMSNKGGKAGEPTNYKEVTLENKVFESAEISTHSERIWRKFYKNNFF